MHDHASCIVNQIVSNARCIEEDVCDYITGTFLILPKARIAASLVTVDEAASSSTWFRSWWWQMAAVHSDVDVDVDVV